MKIFVVSKCWEYEGRHPVVAYHTKEEADAKAAELESEEDPNGPIFYSVDGCKLK